MKTPSNAKTVLRRLAATAACLFVTGVASTSALAQTSLILTECETTTATRHCASPLYKPSARILAKVFGGIYIRGSVAAESGTRGYSSLYSCPSNSRIGCITVATRTAFIGPYGGVSLGLPDSYLDSNRWYYAAAAIGQNSSPQRVGADVRLRTHW